MEKKSFLAILLEKQSAIKRIKSETHLNCDSVLNDVNRQIKQVSKINHGDPITGAGVTKSGQWD